MKELSVEEQIYLCKYHDIDTSLDVSLGINKCEAEQILNKLKNNGMYEQYRNLSEEEYENIIHIENRKDKFDKILDKYNFENDSNKYYIIKDLFMIANKVKNTDDFKLKDIISQLAKNRKTTASSIENESNRILNKTYELNKMLFKQNGYKNKPSLKEFLSKELNLIDNIKIQETKENVYKAKENMHDSKHIENITETNNYQEQKGLPPILNADMIVQVPLGTVLNYYYLKRIYRCYRRTSKRRGITRNKINNILN